MFYRFHIHFASQIDKKVCTTFFKAEKRSHSWSYSFKISVSLLTKYKIIVINGDDENELFRIDFVLL